MKKEFKISGMSCAACVRSVEKAALGVKGVDSANVSLSTSLLSADGEFSDAELIKAIEDAGYSAELKQDNFTASEAHSTEAKKLLRRFLVSVIIVLPLMYLAMGGMIGLPQPSGLIGRKVSVIIQCVLAVSVMVINRNFYINAVKHLRHKSFNMDTLVSVGSIASLGVGIAGLVITLKAGTLAEAEAAHDMLYFDSAAMVVALVTLGKFLEAVSKKRTTKAIDALIKLKTRTARVIVDGAEKIIPISELKVGDEFIVKAGEGIPTDGIIIGGDGGSVNESAITGESIPRDVKVGDSVIGACVLESGYITVRAEKVGSDTTLSEIIEAVENASASKAKMGRIADKISGVFVPVIMLIALAVVVIWLIVTGGDVTQSIIRGASVLVVSCPCALGLATPIAITASVGRAASEGIFVRGAEALERAGKIKLVVFDKTGTLTEGKPRVITFTGDENALRIVGSIESKSNHPLSLAICEYCKAKNIETTECEDFKQYYGGISGVVDGTLYYISSVKIADGKGIGLTKSFKDIKAIEEVGGSALIAYSESGDVLSIIGIADSIRESAELAISELQARGIKTALLTGDSAAAGMHVGIKLGVDKVMTGLKPRDKAEFIKTEQSRGTNVAFVGDGINDAPSLARADAGFAMGGGTEVAIGAADFVLSGGDLTKVSKGIILSQKSGRIIKENLFWAFIYNLLCVPIAGGALAAVGVLITPMIGAAAMSLSSVCVVLNSLRLYAVRLSHKKQKKVKDNRNNKGDNEVMKIAETKDFKVDGMMCKHCETRVKAAVEGLGYTCEVLLKKGMIKVQSDADDDKVIEAVKAAGYECRRI